MPLDVQPLSPQRRAVMLLVLLGLFGVSLGFADWLVVRKKPQAVRYQVSVRAPAGLTEPVQAWEGVEGVILTGQGRVKEFENRLRQFGAFSYEDDLQSGELESAAIEKFRDVSGEKPTQRRMAPMAGLPGVQLEGEYGEGKESSFMLMRMAAVPGRVVAICYSGEGNLTDADRMIFELICRGVTIKVAGRGS